MPPPESGALARSRRRRLVVSPISVFAVDMGELCAPYGYGVT